MAFETASSNLPSATYSALGTSRSLSSRGELWQKAKWQRMIELSLEDADTKLRSWIERMDIAVLSRGPVVCSDRWLGARHQTVRRGADRD